VSTTKLTTTSLENWLTRYKQAWERRDADQAAALFTDSARYQEMPFDDPKLGRAGIRNYWTTVTADQRDIEFSFEVIAVKDSTGIARWSATFKSAASGARVDLDGVFVLEFAPDGLCTELREWWHVRTVP
jgi:hypothetical protein